LTKPSGHSILSSMTLADKITSLRLIFAPLFVIVYLLPWGLLSPALVVGLLWFIFVLSELTDMIDGQIARRFKVESDFGKLFDPFADTLTQLSYFLCFVQEEIFPSILYLLVIYREFSILFIRNLMLRKGITMGARKAGKIKTVTYIVSGALALLALSLDRLDIPLPAARTAALIAFCISLVFSIYSFIDYLEVYRKAV